MSRVLSDDFKAQVTASILSPAIFIQFKFDSGDLNLWSGIHDRTWNGDNFIGSGSILSISDIEETQGLRATNLTFGLSGISSTVIALALTSNYQGREAYMWFAVLDQNQNIISDPYEIFNGRIDVINFTDNGETSDFFIKCESNMVDIRKVKERRYTVEEQKINFPNDKGLDFVAKIKDINITWGASG